MSKKVKIGLVIAGLLVLAIAVYYFFFSGSSANWAEMPGKDVPGAEMSDETGVTLDQAKAKALSIGAKAFVYYPGTMRAFYKSSAAVTNGWNPGTYSTYVKQ